MNLNDLANEADCLNMPELAWVFRMMSGTDYTAHPDRLRGDYAQMLESARRMRQSGTPQTVSLYERAAHALEAMGAKDAWERGWRPSSRGGFVIITTTDIARFHATRSRPRRPPSMRNLSPDDLEALAAIAETALDESVETLSLAHPAAPGVLLEVTCDGAGIVAATWRLGGAWWAADVGEG